MFIANLICYSNLGYQVLLTSKQIISKLTQVISKMAFQFGTVTNEEIKKINKEALPNNT